MKTPAFVTDKYKDTIGIIEFFIDEPNGPYFTVTKSPTGESGWASAIVKDGRLDFITVRQVSRD